MRSGMIYLYDKGGCDLLAYRKYKGLTERKLILRSWRRNYAMRYYDCIIHICPSVNTAHVHKNGENSRKNPDEYSDKKYYDITHTRKDEQR